MIIQEKIVCMGLSVLKSINSCVSLGLLIYLSAQNLGYGSRLRAGGQTRRSIPSANSLI